MDAAQIHEQQLISYRGITPQVQPGVFVAQGAMIIGDVHIGEDSSVWFNAVIRGDVNYIRIGQMTNVQDLCMLHVTHEKYPLTIGSHITIGHSATLHGCTIKDFVLIGMGATVLDGAVIESNSMVAAGAVVREGMKVPEGVLVAGVPARIVRDLNEDEVKKIQQSAINYKNYVLSYTQNS